jgi:N4-gp56 family major capsid protein
MAITQYGVNDALSNKLWARDLNHEVKKGLEIAPLIGKGPNSIIQEKSEFKGRGDKVTIGLRTRLTGTGVTENETLEGNEEALTTYSDSLLINEIAHAVRVEGEDSIDQQRVLFNLREEARDGLADWFAERLSLSFFVQASGYSASSITYRGSSVTLASVHKGLNTVTAPSTNRKVMAGSGNTNDEDLVSADTFSLSMIDKAKEKAVLANPRIRPIRINGKDMYCCYLHPTQAYDLMVDTGSMGWREIQLAAIQGGQSSDNPIFTGALGVYNNVVLRVNEDVVTGINSSTAAEITTVRRALFLGAQAACIGFSSKFSKSSPYKWVEKKFDYDRELGVSVQGLMGLKKNIFNSEDFGVLTLSTYATTH